jgi:signal transduction histidine kinase
MDDCAKRMHALVTGLLDYSRTAGDGAPPVATLMGDALADAVANLRPLLDRTGSSVEMTGDLPAVKAGRRELAQVFQNLISNSVIHSGGRPVRVAVGADSEPDEATVRVSDDGPGLGADQMERAFGLFERAGAQTAAGPTPSTGLGLPICRRIITRLGGRIWMEPNAGGGLSVLFCLPAPT